MGETCVANLIADGQAVAASGIGGAETDSGFLLDHDAFRVAQVTLFSERVAARGQRSLCVAREAPWFADHLVRQPLMMNARRVDRLLNVHVVVDHVCDYTEHGV